MKKDDALSKTNEQQKCVAHVFDAIEGLKSVAPDELEDFVRAMTEEVIPEIVRVVEERRMLAAESRHWQLKC